MCPAHVHSLAQVENVLRGSDGLYKLCDFGSATREPPLRLKTTADIGRWEDVLRRKTTACYRAPEIVDLYRRKEIGTKADVWVG